MTIPWSTLSWQQVEAVVAVLLGRQLPYSVRFRPARGDGGVDVLDPQADGTSDVFQIKSFYGSLDRSRQRQVEDSLRRVASNPDVLVRTWYLVVPTLPSADEWKWFTRLGAEYPFDCHWFDLDRIEGLAAKYPEVGDYYLHDGRLRLEGLIGDLRALLGMVRPADRSVLTAADLQEPLVALHRALNRDDPHYRYDIEVSGSPPSMDTERDRPWLVATVSRSDEDTTVTNRVHAKYLMAVADRPIPLSVTVQAGRFDADTAAAWDRAMRYGTAVQLSRGLVTDFCADLPGGLHADAAQVLSLRMSSAVDAGSEPYALRLRLVGQDEVVVAEAVLRMMPRTRGSGGIRVHGRERGGTFELEILTDIAADGVLGNVKLSLNLCDLAGLQPAEVFEGIQFLAGFHRPNRLQFAPEFGPAAQQVFDLPTSEAPITEHLLHFADALAVLQQEIDAELRFPDLESLTNRVYTEATRAAALVRGEIVSDVWEEVEIGVKELQSFEKGPHQLAISGSYTILVGAQTVTVSPVTLVLLAAEIDALTRDGKDFVLARPTLGNNTRLTMRRALDDVPVQGVGDWEALMAEHRRSRQGKLLDDRRRPDRSRATRRANG